MSNLTADQARKMVTDCRAILNFAIEIGASTDAIAGLSANLDKAIIAENEILWAGKKFGQ